MSKKRVYLQRKGPYMDRSRQELVIRYKRNPIITLHDMPFPCNTVFNAGAAKYQDEYILLVRVEGLEGKSFFALARSKNGFDFDTEEVPVMEPAQEIPFSIYEKRGIEDPRITKIDDTYYILYTAYSVHGPRLGLAKTPDFKKFERIALVSQPENKDAVLFPTKIGGRYVRFDRPSTSAGAIIYLYLSFIRLRHHAACKHHIRHITCPLIMLPRSKHGNLRTSYFLRRVLEVKKDTS